MLLEIKKSILLLLVFTFLTGIIYPLLITGVAQLFFSFSANGSLIERDGKIIGSWLIGQSFTEEKYFWGRPSATSSYSYNALQSSGSNLAPLNPALLSAIKHRAEILQQADPQNHHAIPVDLVTASASGLDPHISVASALYQAPRIARARHLSPAQVEALIHHQTKNSVCNLLGAPRINVLQLNMTLDDL